MEKEMAVKGQVFDKATATMGVLLNALITNKLVEATITRDPDTDEVHIKMKLE